MISQNTLPSSINYTDFDTAGDYHFLILPGYQNSGPGHWQTNWESLYPGQFTRVGQENWNYPEKDNWVNTIDKYVNHSSKPVVLIAHSLGCVAAVHWCSGHPSLKVAGALLVAPADAERSPNLVINLFSPVPVDRLPFPSILVASTNDPFAATERQAYYAACWGSKFVSVGNKGHINAASGLGNWEEGLDILQHQLVGRLIEGKQAGN